MHILVSNHNAEVSTFRSGIGRAAHDLHIVENNLSALSLIGSHSNEVASLVITEHQDQAVNVDTEVFVQNIVPRLLSSTDVIVVGDLIAVPDSVQLVETISDAAAIVGREPKLPTAVPSPPEPVTAPVEQANTEVKRNGRHKSPRLAELVTVAEAPAARPGLSEGTTVLPDPAATVLLIEEPLPEAPMAPAGQPEHSTSEPPTEHTAEPPVERAVTAAARPASPVPDHPSAALPGWPERAASAVDSQAPLPVAAAKSVVTAPVGLPDPQVMAEIPETTRSLADDIRDWNERQRDERGEPRSNERRPASFGELLRSWMPGQRRLREQEDKLDTAIRAPRLHTLQQHRRDQPQGRRRQELLDLSGRQLSGRGARRQGDRDRHQSRLRHPGRPGARS